MIEVRVHLEINYKEVLHQPLAASSAMCRRASQSKCLWLAESVRKHTIGLRLGVLYQLERERRGKIDQLVHEYSGRPCM